MNKSIYFLILFLLSFISCTSQNVIEDDRKNDKDLEQSSRVNQDSLDIMAFYESHSNNEASQSIGSVSNGKLVNGKLIPFYGPNFTYFDKESYYAMRGCTSDKVKSIILGAYDKMSVIEPERQFYLMEMSNECGGEIYPHRTHQNGLSVDFMMPKLRNNEPCYDLDTIGAQHYFLTFTDEGASIEDTSIVVDFEMIAKHILKVQEAAIEEGYSISKVIIKLEYKKKLFDTPSGKLLAKSGIYFTQNLTPLINSIHDDHYHIDFKKLP